MSPRAPWETGKTTSLTAVDTRDERGRFGRARSRASQAAASRNKLQPVARRGEPRGQMLCTHAHDDLLPSSCTSPRLRGSSRYMPVKDHVACEDHAQMHASAAACFGCGGSHAHCTPRERSRALPPTLPRPRHSSCARRRARGGCCSTTVEAFCTRPSVGTGAYLGPVPVEEAQRVPCHAEAGREPSTPLSSISRKS